MHSERSVFDEAMDTSCNKDNFDQLLFTTKAAKPWNKVVSYIKERSESSE